MDKIFITDLKAQSIIGIKTLERKNKQEIIINCTFFTQTRMAGLHDSILETINYSSAAKFILAFLDKSCFYTVEALAENIAEALISEFNPQSVCIKIEKTQVLTSAKSVGVEIQRP